LPDKHIVKMPLETCQMLSIIYSKWYLNWSVLLKKDGTPYQTEKGAFRNHPCTQWASQSIPNLAWLIAHGLALCDEYSYRYQKVHSCQTAIQQALEIFEENTLSPLNIYQQADHFVRAMPEDLKNDHTIDTFTAYKKYINTKQWVHDNYIKPERKPIWMEF